MLYYGCWRKSFLYFRGYVGSFIRIFLVFFVRIDFGIMNDEEDLFSEIDIIRDLCGL